MFLVYSITGAVFSATHCLNVLNKKAEIIKIINPVGTRRLVAVSATMEMIDPSEAIIVAEVSVDDGTCSARKSTSSMDTSVAKCFWTALKNGK